jgi:microcin C transport system substrate-binding protein
MKTNGESISIGKALGLPLLGAALAAAVLLGCNRKDGGSASASGSKVVDKPVTLDSAGEADPIANPAAVTGGSLNIWQGAFPKSLNKWLEYTSTTVMITGLMFETLVDLHSVEDREVGILAESWTVSDDKKTFTFRLDPRARWSDGKPVTTDDVLFYYDVIMDPKNLTSLFRVGLKRFEKPVKIDSLTFSFTAKEVHWNNFWELASISPLPRHAWGGKDFNQQHFEFPVVNGPYRLGEVKKDRSISLKRRGDWWGRVKRYNQHKWNFDEIRLRAMDDQIKVLEAFKKGDYDVYPVYTAMIWATKTDFDQVKKNWVVRQRVFNKEPIGYQGMAINLRRPKFQDVRVRKALSHLINRDLMNEKLMYNQYFLLNSYFPDLFDGNRNPKAPLIPYDPKKARELLAEAGWKPGSDGILRKDGKPFEIVIPNHSAEVRHMTVYIEDLKKVGIQARIDQISYATFAKRMDNHEFDLAWVAWGSSRLRDPEAAWHSSTANEVSTNNYPGVQDKAVDSLIELQKSEMDLAKRNAILAQLDTRLTEIVPYVLLWQSDNHRLLYWNRFGTPRHVLDKFNREEVIPVYWFADPAKEKALKEARSSGAALPAEPVDVHYRD